MDGHFLARRFTLFYERLGEGHVQEVNSQTSYNTDFVWLAESPPFAFEYNCCIKDAPASQKRCLE